MQPILAGGLIALAAAGSSLLGERLNRRHGVALALVVIAVVAVAASARGTAALATRVPGGRLLLLITVAAIIAGAAIQIGSLRNGRTGGRDVRDVWGVRRPVPRCLRRDCCKTASGQWRKRRCPPVWSAACR